MTRTVVGHYVSADAAQSALARLESAGFLKDDLNYVAHDGSGRLADLLGGKGRPRTGTTAGTVSGVLLGLTALSIPGVGPAVAAGPIAVALAGAATGGLMGALADMGVPETQAKEWADRVTGGGALVIVRANSDTAPRAQEVLAQDAEAVRVHDETAAGETADPHADFANYGSDGGSSQWGQRVLRVEGDRSVIAGRTVSRDKGSRRFDEKGDRG